MFFLRKVLFYFFVGIYLIFCPLIVAYALGYIYKPGSELGIVKSGLIYLSTAPQAASVYLGNRRYTKRTPTVLPNLLPGDYPLRLELKGYRPWSETVPVEAGKATVFEKVLLLPDVFGEKELATGPFTDLIPLEGTRFFILKSGSKVRDLRLYDWKSEKKLRLVAENFHLNDAEISSIFKVQRSPAFLLQVSFDGKDEFLWVVSKAEEAQMKQVTHLFFRKPERVEWDHDDKRFLFAFHDGHVERLDVNSGTTDPSFLEGVQGYGFLQKRIYVLKSNGVFERMDLAGEKERLLIQDPSFGNSIFGTKGFYQINIFSDDLMVFLGEEGALISNRLPYRFVDEGVRGLEFYPKLKRLLLWRENAIGVLDFSTERNLQGAFESGPELKWVYKKGERIEQAFWLYEGSHILFRDGNKVYVLELETYGKPHLHFLFEVKSKSSIFYSEDSGQIYYLKPNANALFFTEILPRKEIIPLPFPERREERKKVEIGEL